MFAPPARCNDLCHGVTAVFANTASSNKMGGDLTHAQAIELLYKDREKTNKMGKAGRKKELELYNEKNIK